MNREGKKCVLYPRVSTEMQVDGYSLEGQKNGLKRFADREEMEIVGIYEDAGKSGKSIEGRPAFKKMLSDIKNGLEIDYILVYKLSRFGRNAADILNSLEFVQSYGINLICIEEGIDSSQTSGKLLISVLSAVAEIERENIIEQTMNGRREKARQGGWNGGFAPYGYYLKDNQLLIEETEAEAIRIIFDKFANSDIGLGGVAKYLNLQGIKKIPRQNGTLETWSSHFIRLILDNPVYCGKIAYGRRTREKVKGTKNEYKQVHAEDYILEDGQHEGIISEELWQKVHAKRMATGIKQPSKIGKDRSHLLTGILKCPLCGSSMYTNKHAWTNKDGTYKEVYYYICGRNKQERGHHCDYKASLRKTDIEPLVIEAVKELVSDKYFAEEIEKRIGVQTDTTAIDKELTNYESKLKEVDLNKARLEREIDNLPVDARFRERKIHDMTLRLDALYDTIVELEERIEDAKLRRSSIEMEAITLDNIYRLMLNFGKLYDIISDEEKKSLITYLIKEIQIYPNGESENPLKSIEFNFPIYRDGQEVRRLLWEKGNTVECIVTNKKIQESHIEISGEKFWVLGDADASVLPQYILVCLKLDDTVIQERVVSKDADGRWLYTFDEVPKYDANGDEIYYWIEEVPLDGFTASYKDYNITNTYVPKPSMVLPEIEKQIIGENPPEKTFTFVLTGLEGAPMPEGASGQSLLINITGCGRADIGTVTFENAGTYVYTLEETLWDWEDWTMDASVYTLTYEVTETDGVFEVKQTVQKDNTVVDAACLSFTNIYTNPEEAKKDEKIIIAGQKKWSHRSNLIKNWPTEITVYIYGDDELVSELVVTEAENWSYMIELPKYAEDGHAISYTVGEKPVAGYDTQIQGYNILNTYHLEDETDGTNGGDTGTPGGNSNENGSATTGDRMDVTKYKITMMVSFFGVMQILILWMSEKKRKSLNSETSRNKD